MSVILYERKIVLKQKCDEVLKLYIVVPPALNKNFIERPAAFLNLCMCIRNYLIGFSFLNFNLHAKFYVVVAYIQTLAAHYLTKASAENC